MSARQVSFSNRAADIESAAESCLSRRQFILAFGLKTAVLAGASDGMWEKRRSEAAAAGK